MSVESNQNTINPDLEATAEVRRVLTGMQDAMTDEMVSRIAATVSDSAGLLDQLNRSGIDKAIPVLATLVESGDLERIAQLARVAGSIQDAMTDEMLARLTELISQTMSLLDRLNRAGLDNLVSMLPRIITLFEQLEEHHVIDDFVSCLDNAKEKTLITPPARGGLRGLWGMAKDPETQEAIRFLLSISNQFRTCRTHRQSVQNES